jgi:hypothetical protein
MAYPEAVLVQPGLDVLALGLVLLLAGVGDANVGNALAAAGCLLVHGVPALLGQYGSS